VLLDSNILMLAGKLRLDPFAGVEELLQRHVEFGMIPQVIEELERISRKPTKEGKLAALALELAKRCVVWDQSDSEGPADDAIVRAAIELGAAVCTADSELRRRLRGRGLPVIYIRERSKFCLDGIVRS